MIETVVALFALGLATATVAITLTKTKVFLQLRHYVKQRNEWLGDLFTCPYCISHWVSFGLVAIYRPTIVHSGLAPIDWFVSALVVIALAAVWAGFIYKAFLPAGSTADTSAPVRSSGPMRTGESR